MKKNGFTLIEVLGAVTLLAILSLIVVMVVDKSLKDSKETLSSVQIENIRSAAGMWRTDNIQVIPEDGYFTIFLSTLQDNGYIDNEVIDLGNDQVFDRNLLIKVGINDILVGDEIDYSNFDDEILIMANNEVDIINDGISNAFGLEDGIYYFDSNGNLEKDGFIISLNNNSVVRGNILVHNHKFISGCLAYNDHNYDYYKGTLTMYDYPCSTVRGENLVINGDLSYHDNTNFNAFTYSPEGYLSLTSKFIGIKMTEYYIPIDATKNYEIGFTARISNTSSLYYAGFVEYDIDNRIAGSNSYIGSTSIQYLNNTLTTLAQDLNNGDEYIYLTNMTKWNKTASQTYYRGFIFWNYIDSTGYQYPELTYSKNCWTNLYENENIDLVNNRIRLNSAWNHGYIKAGTKLSQSNSGATYNFTLLANQSLTEDFRTYSTVIEGTNNTGTRNSEKFDSGTKYIKFYIWQNSWNNYNSTESITLDIKDIYIKEVIN